MVQAVRKAARPLRRDFNEVEHLQVSKKGPSDFVTAADLRAEKTLREELGRVRPGYGFLLEEGGRVEGTDKSHTWIVDPLDGTLNFMHGLPHFAISVGLLRDGVLQAGVIYNPITDELFTAERGKGAFVNDRRLRVSARSRMEEAVFATGIPFRGHGEHDRFVKELSRIMPQVAGIRRFGSAALDLAFVAAGRYEGFWESSLKPWDMAAGVLLVKEAGGTVTDPGGGESYLETGDVVATNGAMHRSLLSELK